MFDFRLKVFYTVAQHLNFTKASKELLISQPAVTKHIKEIEKLLSIRVFKRENNHIYLTEAGKILYKKSKKIFSLYNELEYEIGTIREQYSGKLSIGASSTIAQWVIPEVLSKFKKAYPTIEISLMNANSENIEKALQNNKIDIGIVEGSHIKKELKYSFFKDDILLPVVSSNNNLSKIKNISLKELPNMPLVLREEGSGTLEVILKTLYSKKEITLSDLNVVMHLGSTEGIKTYLQHSDTMAIVSCCAVQNEIESGTLKQLHIRDVKFKRTFRFVTCKETPSGLVNKFMSFAKHNYNL